MELRVYDTFVNTPMLKDDHVESTVENIVRILADICGKTEKVIHRYAVEDHGEILTTRCAAAEYARFVDAVEELYPDLCEFNMRMV